jgi:alpha-tubulin suppressor-like RCC1 family protein
MTTKTNYTFAILNSDGTSSTTYVDMDDMFVSADTFVEKGLYAWGNGTGGKLGDGTIVSKSSPVQIGSLTDWKQISAGDSHTVAVKTGGTLWAWGTNTNGRLGDNTTVAKSSPVQIGSLTNWKQVSASTHTLAVKTDGTLWAWGLGTAGQLGDSAFTTRSSPVQIGLLTDWHQVAVGVQHSLAVKTDGTLWAWGVNNDGQLGDGTVVNTSSPVQIGLLNNWRQVSAGINGRFSAAIKTDGTLWAWGTNNLGQLGDGTAVNASSPVQVGALTNWKQVSCGTDFSVAVTTNGNLYAWGNGATGRLGDNTTVAKSSPVQIGALTNWKQVSARSDGGNASAIKTDGTLWAWGNGGTGRLGDGTIVSKSSPVQIGTLTSWNQVTVGNDYTVGVLNFDGLSGSSY